MELLLNSSLSSLSKFWIFHQILLFRYIYMFARLLCSHLFLHPPQQFSLATKEAALAWQQVALLIQSFTLCLVQKNYVMYQCCQPYYHNSFSSKEHTFPESRIKEE